MKKVLACVALLTASSCTGSGDRQPILATGQRPGPSANVIAFTSRRGGWWSIYTMNSSGTAVRKLTDIISVKNGPHHSFLDLLGQPAWSPNGKAAAFVCTPGLSAICIVNADGSGASILARRYEDVQPAWSPDGMQIAFTRFDRGGNADIWVMAAGGSDQHRLTSGPELDGGANWSPDGKRIVFLREEHGQFDILEHECKWFRAEEPHAQQAVRGDSFVLSERRADCVHYG